MLYPELEEDTIGELQNLAALGLEGSYLCLILPRSRKEKKRPKKTLK